MRVPGFSRTRDVNPIEAFLLFACELQGFGVLLGIARPTSVREALLPAAMYFWAGLLALGGFTSLLGLFWWGDQFNGIEILRVGLVAVGGGTSVYAVSAALLGSVGFAVAISNALFSVACIVRIRQLARGSKRLRSFTDDQRGGASERGEQGG